MKDSTITDLRPCDAELIEVIRESDETTTIALCALVAAISEAPKEDKEQMVEILMREHSQDMLAEAFKGLCYAREKETSERFREYLTAGIEFFKQYALVE